MVKTQQPSDHQTDTKQKTDNLGTFSRPKGKIPPTKTEDERDKTVGCWAAGATKREEKSGEAGKKRKIVDFLYKTRIYHFNSSG